MLQTFKIRLRKFVFIGLGCATKAGNSGRLQLKRFQKRKREAKHDLDDRSEEK